MPRLSMEFPHALGRAEAARRLKEKFAAAYAEHQGRVSKLRQQWKDHNFSFSFQTLGMTVGGTVAVEPEKVVLEANLPLAAMLLKPAIENRLHKEAGALLAS